ncbi:beta-alanine--pyruvate transaminase [Natronocella acetinitrilica]|uniref:Beta-alanine--pyruvate transaminase n=1 Tax=Natronocella acetinitrilica TaxID=414046 RepID=A0AAE3G179_9GAMM|nr:aspartate aminotransferase family protein [Natronocella acetinitrilica]MCP1673695.1 beta-alanine--pyruvate transaminase [Natronocella acetinitrilica]
MATASEHVLPPNEDDARWAGLSRAELEAYWMPFSGNRQFKDDPRMIVGAHDCYLRSADGRDILDTLSGLWCCSFGHGRSEIAEAIGRCAKELAYSPPFQFGHPMAFQLANRVRELTPDGLDHVFFTNSGSESADTALKMAKAYWRLKGRPEKTRMIGRIKGYHGVNVGGTSVGGIVGNRKHFGSLMESDHLSATLLPENRFSRGTPEHGVHLADQLEELVGLHDASNIAAVVVEPMSGSAGVIVPPAGYLKRLREICDKHDILLVFDEVLTGFGRTGSDFGATLFGVTPDIMTLAKNITNGAVPMGAVVSSAEIYRTFMDNGGPDYVPEFPHGYTYSAHPIACAAGLAAMDIFEHDRMAERAGAMAPYFEEQVHQLKGLRHIVDIRNLGMAAAIQLEPHPREATRRPFEIAMRCWEKGMYVRFAADTIQLGPPFIVEREQVDQMCNILADVIPTID